MPGCTKSFIRKTILTRHIKSVHPMCSKGPAIQWRPLFEEQHRMQIIAATSNTTYPESSDSSASSMTSSPKLCTQQYISAGITTPSPSPPSLGPTSRTPFYSTSSTLMYERRDSGISLLSPKQDEFVEESGYFTLDPTAFVLLPQPILRL